MSEKDLNGAALISVLLGMVVLLGEEGTNWEYIETDPVWWRVRLWTRIN